MLFYIWWKFSIGAHCQTTAFIFFMKNMQNIPRVLGLECCHISNRLFFYQQFCFKMWNSRIPLLTAGLQANLNMIFGNPQRKPVFIPVFISKCWLIQVWRNMFLSSYHEQILIHVNTLQSLCDTLEQTCLAIMTQFYAWIYVIA